VLRCRVRGLPPPHRSHSAFAFCCVAQPTGCSCFCFPLRDLSSTLHSPLYKSTRYPTTNQARSTSSDSTYPIAMPPSVALVTTMHVVSQLRLMSPRYSPSQIIVARPSTRGIAIQIAIQPGFMLRSC
jgi:hypothetical protein